MDISRSLIQTIGKVLEDAELHGMTPTISMKRLAAYGLLLEAKLDEMEDSEEELEIIFTPEGDDENGSQCIVCHDPLVGKQRKFCSTSCAKADWRANNKTRIRNYQRKWYRKNKSKLRVVK